MHHRPRLFPPFGQMCGTLKWKSRKSKRVCHFFIDRLTNVHDIIIRILQKSAKAAQCTGFIAQLLNWAAIFVLNVLTFGIGVHASNTFYLQFFYSPGLIRWSPLKHSKIIRKSLSFLWSNSPAILLPSSVTPFFHS